MAERAAAWRTDEVLDYLGYEPYFTDAQHGWLYGMAWTAPGDLVWQVVEQLWRTSDGGHTWTLVRGRLPLQGVMDNGDEICPDEGPFHIAFASQQDGWLTAGSCPSIGSAPRVWRTTDGGVTWTPAMLPAPPQGWPSASDTYGGVPAGIPWVVGSELLVAVGDRSAQASLDVEASSDGGRNWTLASRVSFPRPEYVSPSTFEPIDASHWVVSVPGEIMHTSDAGQTWRVSGHGSALTGGPFWFTSPGQGYTRGPGGIILATADGGRSWNAGSPLPRKLPARGPAVTSIQELSPTFAIAAGLTGLRVSSDGGRTWTPLTLRPGPLPLRFAQFLDHGTGFVLDHIGRRLWRTTDGGRTWTQLELPPIVQVKEVRFWDSASGLAMTRGSIFGTATSGRTWRRLAEPRGYTSLAPNDPMHQPNYSYACFASASAGWLAAESLHSQDVVFLSTDAGTRWRQVLAPGAFQSGKKVQEHAVWMSGCRGSQAWVAYTQGPYGSATPTFDLLHTADAGHTWQDVLRLQNGTKVPPLALPHSPGALASAALPSGLNLTPEPLALAASASDAWQTLLAPGGGLAFAVTADGGQHWQFRWFPAPARPLRAAPASPSVFPAGLPWLATTATDARHAWVLFGSTNGSGDCYLYATGDGGATWQRITTFR